MTPRFRLWLEGPVTMPRWVVLGCIISAAGFGVWAGWAAHILWRIR